MGNLAIVLTRFNLPLKFGKTSNRDFGIIPGKTNLDPGWLSKRIELFQKYCVPSVKSQMSLIHRWFVMFDPMTPSDVVSAICSFPGVEPIYAESQGQAMKLVLQNVGAGESVLTVRLDSDDMLARDFFETLLPVLADTERLVSSAPLAISFPEGCEFDAEKKCFFNRQYTFNPFISVYERYVAFNTFFGAYGSAHHRIATSVRCLSIPTESPMWCINVHGGNVANEIKGSLSEINFNERFMIPQ